VGGGGGGGGGGVCLGPTLGVLQGRMAIEIKGRFVLSFLKEFTGSKTNRSVRNIG